MPKLSVLFRSTNSYINVSSVLSSISAPLLHFTVNKHTHKFIARSIANDKQVYSHLIISAEDLLHLTESALANRCITNWPCLFQLVWSFFFNLMLPGSTGPHGSMSQPKGSHHTIPDQIPEWVYCEYWECEHWQVHSQEVQSHLSATLKSSLKLWQCVSGCRECSGTGSCNKMHSTIHQWVKMLICYGK